MTIHAAKGLEFPYVFLCCLNEGILPSKKTDSPEGMEEERRLAFVALTRAKRGLVLSDSEVVTIKLLETGCRVAVSVDGEVVQCVDGESSIQIVSAQHRAKFVRFPSTPNFYEKLLDKLNKWSTTL